MPHELLEIQLRWLQAIAESRTPFWTAIFQFFTELGDTSGYLFAVPLLVWLSLTPRRGYQLMFWIGLSFFVNTILKDWIQEPRPSTFGSLEALGETDSLSFPSGHAQIAATFWGVLYGQFRTKWVGILAFVFVFMTGLSRVYLGMHYPLDIIAGWLLGGLLAWMSVAIAPKLEAIEHARGPFWLYWSIAVAALLLVATHWVPDAARALGFVIGASVVLPLVIHRIDLGWRPANVHLFPITLIGLTGLHGIQLISELTTGMSRTTHTFLFSYVNGAWIFLILLPFAFHARRQLAAPNKTRSPAV